VSDAAQYRALVGDLLTWLRQNETPQGAWYWDEDPAPVVEPPAKEAVAPKAPAAPAATVSDAAPDSPDDDPFAAECEAFVAAAMERIGSHRAESEALPGLEETAPPADPASALDALRQEVLPCIACGLAETRKNVVFGSGSARAELMIVGEAPGRDEDIQGQPFVGRSGQLLTKILAAIGLRRDEVYIGNILKCRPPDNRDPLPPEVLACEPHLRLQLAIIRPRLICCLGRVAAQTLLRTSTSLTRLRGEVHFYGDIPVLATFHPAYLLRNPAAKRDAWNDVRMMKALMEALAAADPGRGA